MPSSNRSLPRAGQAAEAKSAEPASTTGGEPQSREARIAARAYFKALDRGFVPGSELEDWLLAEKEIDALPDSVTATGSATSAGALRPDPNSPLWRS